MSWNWDRVRGWFEDTTPADPSVTTMLPVYAGAGPDAPPETVAPERLCPRWDEPNVDDPFCWGPA